MWFKALVVTLFAVSIFVRILAFNQEGGDHLTYKQAVDEFLSGTNPYKYTVMSFETVNQKHGYAYMPTLLYIQASLVKLNGFLHLDAPTVILWKIPVLLADICIGLIIYLVTTKGGYSKLVTVLGLVFWFFNPYFIMRYEYTNYETLPILFMLLTLLTIGKKEFAAGVLFAIAVSLKTFPIILLAILLFKAKNIKNFFNRSICSC
ncbi:hypothetical protein HGB13_05200 [bacterium]|nr:hypothetical protein [bacterium]